MAGVDQMRQQLLKTFFLLIFLSFSSLSQAQALYPVMGEISQLSDSTITVMDTKLRLSPTVKIYSRSGKTISIDNLKPGDRVGLQTTRLNGKVLVDSINVIKR